MELRIIVEMRRYCRNCATSMARDAVYGMLQARARTRRGEFVNIDKPPEPASHYSIENVGYLKL